MFVTAVAMMAFGTDETGVAAFAGSGSLLGDLGSRYLAGWVGEIVTIGAVISASACALACVLGAARLLFALSRDGVGFAALRQVSPTRGTPVYATVAVVLAVYLFIGSAWFVLGATPFDVYIASGTAGTLILLTAYALATVGAARHGRDRCRRP